MTSPSTHEASRYGVLVSRPRIWAVASIHADVKRLEAIHDTIQRRLQPGDGLVYLGNLLGYGNAVMETVAELLSFRRGFIARQGSFATDLVYLRGSQEEMWQKLLELQFAPNPREIFDWMLDHGLGSTLAAYGARPQDGIIAAREGPVSITRWTNGIRASVNAAPGHGSLLTALRRAAYTHYNELLFVHAGLDPARPLNAQRDSFWWGAPGFLEMAEPYGGFRRVVCGFDRQHAGLVATPYALSLDHGCGFGGKLMAACLTLDGQIVESFEA
jgi:serine/threonine protein phosphatase 1